MQEHISTFGVADPLESVAINSETIELIKARKGGARLKVVNLVKRIEKEAEDHSEDPYLIAMAERARMVQDTFEQRQTTTYEALDNLLAELSLNEDRKKQQAEKGFDGLTFFVYLSLLEANISNPEPVSQQIKTAFVNHPNWRTSEAALRDLRQQVTFALFAACDQLEQVTPLVDALFTTLAKGDRIR